MERYTESLAYVQGIPYLSTYVMEKHWISIPLGGLEIVETGRESLNCAKKCGIRARGHSYGGKQCCRANYRMDMWCAAMLPTCFNLGTGESNGSMYACKKSIGVLIFRFRVGLCDEDVFVRRTYATCAIGKISRSFCICTSVWILIRGIQTRKIW